MPATAGWKQRTARTSAAWNILSDRLRLPSGGLGLFRQIVRLAEPEVVLRPPGGLVACLHHPRAQAIAAGQDRQRCKITQQPAAAALASSRQHLQGEWRNRSDARQCPRALRRI